MQFLQIYLLQPYKYCYYLKRWSISMLFISLKYNFPSLFKIKMYIEDSDRACSSKHAHREYSRNGWFCLNNSSSHYKSWRYSSGRVTLTSSVSLAIVVNLPSFLPQIRLDKSSFITHMSPLSYKIILQYLLKNPVICKFWINLHYKYDFFLIIKN